MRKLKYLLFLSIFILTALSRGLFAEDKVATEELKKTDIVAELKGLPDGVLRVTTNADGTLKWLLVKATVKAKDESGKQQEVRALRTVAEPQCKKYLGKWFEENCDFLEAPNMAVTIQTKGDNTKDVAGNPVKIRSPQGQGFKVVTVSLTRQVEKGLENAYYMKGFINDGKDFVFIMYLTPKTLTDRRAFLETEASGNGKPEGAKKEEAPGNGKPKTTEISSTSSPSPVIPAVQPKISAEAPKDPNFVSTVKFVPLAEKEISAIVAKAPKPPRLSPDLNLELVDYIDCTTPQEAHPFVDDGWSKVVEGPMGKYRETTVADNSYFAYRFNTSAVEEPHLVVVEYPDDKERTTSLFLHEEGMKGVFNSDFHVEEGYSSGGEYPNTNKYCYQQLFFWPKAPWPALVCLNIEHGMPAAMSRIWVYRIKGGLTPPHINEPKGAKRQIGTFYEYSHLVRYDYGSQQKGSERLAEFLAYTGQNFFSFDSVMYKWSHCNVPAFETQPGQQPQKDTDTEFMLAACDKYKIGFVAVFDPMKEFEVKSVPTADLTDDKAVQAWISGIGDYIDVYGKHPSLKGVSFGGPAGCNRMNTDKLGALQKGLASMLVTKRPDIQEYAYIGYQYLHHGAFFSQKEKGHWPYADIISQWEKEPATTLDSLIAKNIGNFYQELHFNMKDYQNQNNLVPVRSYYPVDQRVYRTYPLSCSPDYMMYRDFNRSQAVADLVSNGNAPRGACLFGTYFEITPPLFEGLSFWWDRTWIAPQCFPSEPYYMEMYTSALAQDDVSFIVNCGWSDPVNGSASQVREFAQAYRTLPAESFAIRHSAHYMVARDLNLDGKYYFYLLNNHYSEAKVTFSLGTATRADQLVDGKPITPTNGVFTVMLKPYQLQTFTAPSGATISKITIARSEESHQHLQGRIAAFGEKIKRLEKTPAAPVLSKYRTVEKQVTDLLAKGEDETADLTLGYALDNQLASYVDLYIDKPKISCSRTKKKIVIDGNLDEWEGAASVNIDGPANLVSDHWLFNWWKGKEDLSATVLFQYDDENLYVAFKVLDDVMQPKDQIALRFSKDQVSYLSPNEGASSAKIFAMDASRPGEEVKDDKNAANWNYCLKRTSDGYQGEARIALADLKIKPGDRIGLHVMLVDMDLDPVYLKKLARFMFFSMREKMMEWPAHPRKLWKSVRDPQACGELELKP